MKCLLAKPWLKAKWKGDIPDATFIEFKGCTENPDLDIEKH